MPKTKQLITAVLVITQALWLVTPAMAEKPGKDEEWRQRKATPQAMPDSMPQHAPSIRSNRLATDKQQSRLHEQMQQQHGDVRVGSYFQPHHRDAARAYYNQPENQGFCPPGLAKKSNGCLPPGQARNWRKGEPLPRGVVYYEVPRSVALSLGAPPSGYRYVRVASDILLIAIGSQMVIDAMEDMVR